MNTAKLQLPGRCYAISLCSFLTLFFLLSIGSLQAQSHKIDMASQTKIPYNTSSFQKTQTVSIENWKKYNDPKDYSHPDFGRDLDDKPCTNCVEILSKRTANTRYFVNINDPAEFYQIQGYGEINFKKDNHYLALSSNLRALGNNIYENRFYVEPSGIDIGKKQTYLATKHGKLSFNNWTLWTRTKGTETKVGEANWSNYTIGEEGMYIKNVFKGIDAEVLISRGTIKTNFVLKSNQYGVFEDLIFRDEFQHQSPITLEFKEYPISKENTGMVLVKGTENLAEISGAIIYPKGKEAEMSQSALYNIRNTSLGVVVPYNWIKQHIDHYELIIDPVVTGNGAINRAIILGSMYNASCNFVNSCNYNTNVTYPAASTITDLTFSFTYDAYWPCVKDYGALSFSSGSCNHPSSGPPMRCADGNPGSCVGTNLSLITGLGSCLPTPSCLVQSVPITFKFYRSCIGNSGCGSTCINATSSLTFILTGRTVELPSNVAVAINLPATTICAGQSMQATTPGGLYGAPPYTYNWSFSPTGAPSLGTTTNPTIAFPTAGTQTLYLTVTDQCGRTATISRNIIVNSSVTPTVTITANPSGPICPGTNVTFTATPVNGGTPVYQWKRNGGNVGTNSPTYSSNTLVNGDVITVTITSSLGCSGGAVTSAPYTVTVVNNSQPIPNIATLPTITGQCSVTVTTIPRATNPCTGQVVNATTTSPLTYSAQGSYTITWNYVDAGGATASQTQTVLVQDTTSPVPNVTNLPNITGACSVTVTARPTATDNCSGTITATTTSPLTYTSGGTHTITWTYTDAAGNSITQNQQVIINDTTAPVPDVATLPTITGQCSVTITTFPTATDNCSGSVTATTTSPLTYTTAGIHTIVWRYTDAAGNSRTQNQQVDVQDNIPPVPNVTLLPTIRAQCNITITTIPTATDNCSGTVTATTTSPLTYTAQGTYTITWNYTDVSGNTTPQTQQVIIADNQAPVPTVATLPNLSSACTITAIAPTAIDNCTGTITATTTQPTTYSTPGTYTITWNYNDGNGNSQTQTQQIIIGNSTPPVFNTATLPTLSGPCSITVTAIPTATDSCGNIINGTTTDPLTYNHIGTYTIAWTYTDGLGNSNTQNQTVTVINAGNPTPDATNLPTISASCSATITTIPTATDSCGTPITGTTTDPLSYTLQGNHIITWTYTDTNGNSTQQLQSVVIADTAAPVPTLTNLPSAAGDCSVTITTFPTATDNCAGLITATTTDPLTYSVDGVYTITWLYDDGNGNTQTQTQQVVVSDVNPPVPTTTNLPVINGQCSVTVTTRPTAIDLCAGIITGTTSDPLTYTVQGTYTINWTYNDGNGNSIQQSQQIIVQDTTPPVAVTRPVTVNLDINGIASITPNQVNNNSRDNCGIASITLDKTNFTCADLGTVTVNLTVTDIAGNIHSAPALITIRDLIRPVVNTQPVTLFLNATGTVTLNPNQVDDNSTDNCSIVSRTVSQSLFDCSHIGRNTIQLTVTDASGNSNSRNVVVTIAETVAPIAIAHPAVSIALDSNGQAPLTVNEVNNGSSDNCAIATITLSKYFFHCSEVGTHTVTMTVTDHSGNRSTTTTQVTVLPIPVPTTTMPTQEFCVIERATVADIYVNETNVVWYTSATSTQIIPANSLLQNGTYYAALILDTCIGTNRLPITVTLTDTPIPTIDPQLLLCKNEVTRLIDLPVIGTQLTWYSSRTSNVPLPSNTEVYEGDVFYVSQNDGLCESSERLEVKIQTHYCDIIIYNAISANKDGKNDYLIIEGIYYFPENTVQIFNQWGNLVWKTNRYGITGNVFDGHTNTGLMTNGQDLLPFGTYYYVINFVNLEGKQIQKTGYLHLTH